MKIKVLSIAVIVVSLTFGFATLPAANHDVIPDNYEVTLNYEKDDPEECIERLINQLQGTCELTLKSTSCENQPAAPGVSHDCTSTARMTIEGPPEPSPVETSRCYPMAIAVNVLFARGTLEADGVGKLCVHERTGVAFAAGVATKSREGRGVAQESVGDIQGSFPTDSAADQKPFCYLRYKLQRAFVK